MSYGERQKVLGITKSIYKKEKKKRKHMQIKEILLCKNGLRSVSDTAGADLIGLINLLKKLKS